MTKNPHDGIEFQEIGVAFFEPTPRTRTVLRGTLHAVGFRRFYDCHNVVDIVHRLRSETVDLLIVDSDSDTDGICRVVQQIREGLLGYDPFLAIMALTSNAVPATIKRVLDIGCDDLIARPISPKVIAERTANLVHNRKAFVLTPNYVGPNRRGLDREDDGQLKIQVPNALRQKAIGAEISAADTAEFKAAREAVVTHRIAGLAAQIGNEAAKAKSRDPAEADPATEADRSDRMVKLVAVVSELIAEHGTAELRPLGESIARAAGSIATDAPLDSRVLALLGMHGEAITATVCHREDAKALAASVLDHPISSAAE